MKKIILAIAVAAVATMAVVSSASADVTRYQTTTAKWTVTTNGIYDHSYTVTISPCDGSFTGMGQYPSTGAAVDNETISGTIVGTTIKYHGVYTNDPSYTFDVTGMLSNDSITGTATDSLGQSPLAIAGRQVSTTQSHWKNHGEYVSSQGGGSDAAHSCIGMPIH